jgi:hypothetical protein
LFPFYDIMGMVHANHYGASGWDLSWTDSAHPSGDRFRHKTPPGRSPFSAPR